MQYLGLGIEGACFDSDVDRELDMDSLTTKVQELIALDPFMKEQADKAIAWKELGDPESLCAACSTSAEVQEQEKNVLERVSHSKTALSALKRNMKDCQLSTTLLYLVQQVLMLTGYQLPLMCLWVQFVGVGRVL